jgi:hypothetical protein
MVITLQTPAQAGEVRILMRRARVVPLAATVTPGSALLRSIAGEPAKPITPRARPAARADVVPTTQGAGRGAAAFSAGFRGRRR